MKNENNPQRRPGTLWLGFLAALPLTGALLLAGRIDAAAAAAHKPGAITVGEVKSYFTDWWTHDCEKADACTVTFDSPVKIAAAVRHTFQIPPATYTCYPVKVNFTTHWNRGTFHLMHITHAVYYFYRNSFGEWEMGKENERTTEEKDAHQLPG